MRTIRRNLFVIFIDWLDWVSGQLIPPKTVLRSTMVQICLYCRMWKQGKVSTRSWLSWRNRCLRNCCGFILSWDDVLRYQGCLCIPNVDNSIVNILLESQSSRHCFHPGSTKIYCDLEEVYWCIGTKKDITGLVFKCPDYQQVNFEHQNTRYLPQDISIPTWK